MAELTEEQKIIIGVCVGVSAVVLILIIVFICYIFYGKDKKRRRRHGHKEKLYVDRYERNPYPVYEKRVPSMIYDPQPLPPPPPPPMPLPPPVRYYEKPLPAPRPIYRYDTWDRRPEPPRKYESESRWDGVYRNDPIVVPLAEPEYIQSRERGPEPETIYLNKSRRPERYTYVDDQALLPRTNHIRRTVYAAPLRRSRSVHELRRSTPYVGEWARRPDNLNDFNEYALRQGRDPFLWKN